MKTTDRADRNVANLAKAIERESKVPSLEEITWRYGVSSNTARHYLARLANMGLVKARKVGRKLVWEIVNASTAASVDEQPVRAARQVSGEVAPIRSMDQRGRVDASVAASAEDEGAGPRLDPGDAHFGETRHRQHREADPRPSGEASGDRGRQARGSGDGGMGGRREGRYGGYIIREPSREDLLRVEVLAQRVREALSDAPAGDIVSVLASIGVEAAVSMSISEPDDLGHCEVDRDLAQSIINDIRDMGTAGVRNAQVKVMRIQ